MINRQGGKMLKFWCKHKMDFFEKKLVWYLAMKIVLIACTDIVYRRTFFHIFLIIDNGLH